jgi:hypothetical protein
MMVREMAAFAVETKMDEELLGRLSTRPGAAIEAIEQAERALDVRLPETYKRFLLASNGAEGNTGTMYVQFYPVEQLEACNRTLSLQEYVPGLVAIGSDGGGECLALDYRQQGEPALVFVPFIVPEADAVVQLGRTFEEGLRNGPPWGR